MEKSVGFEGDMVTGRAQGQVNDVFRSQAEVVQAMSDPRYDMTLLIVMMYLKN